MPFATLSVRHRRLAAVGLLLLVAVVLFVRHRGSAAAAPPLRVAPLQVAASGAGQGGASEGGATARTAVLVVDVVGAVRRPGLYRLPARTRVADAVARAGGLTAKANRGAVNLAAPLVDGEQIVVGTGATGAGAAAGAPSPQAPVSLSAASAEQLDTLPGIGPVTAQKIVDYRAQHGPFTSVEGLDAIPGIGPARLAQLQGLVVP